MTAMVWVLVALFVWYSPGTVWQADIRLGYYATEAECEAVGARLDLGARYRWEGMEAGPAWLRAWKCAPEQTASVSTTQAGREPPAGARVGPRPAARLIDTARTRAVYYVRASQW